MSEHYTEIKNITDSRLFLRNYVYDSTIHLFREALENNENITINSFSYDVPAKSIILTVPAFDGDYDSINNSFVDYLRNEEVLSIINTPGINTEVINDLASRICNGYVSSLYDIKHICNVDINTIFINL